MSQKPLLDCFGKPFPKALLTDEPAPNLYPFGRRGGRIMPDALKQRSILYSVKFDPENFGVIRV